MKIGILTFHRSINNGAVMQCYSLSKRLQQEFPNSVVEVIDYHMPLVEETVYNTSLLHNLKGSIKNKIAFILRFPYYIKKSQRDKLRKQVFIQALTNLPLSKEKIYTNSVDELIEYINTHYDIVIAGSDAIWNYVVRGFPNPYFLSADIKCNMYSYAASCYGMCYESIPSSQRETIREIFDRYTFLGTRDIESEKFVKFIGSSVKPTHTCDPTAFLDVNDLPIDKERIYTILRERGFDFLRKTIGVMGGEAMCNMLRKMFGNRYQLVSLYNYNKKCDINLDDLSPYEWAFVFRLFSVTVTTYFHGTMLSLRNGVPVLAIALDTDYSKKHITKVEDVLMRLELQEYYFNTDYKKLNFNEIKHKIEYLISHDLSGIIQSKMDKEAQTVTDFFDHIRATEHVNIRK